MIPRTRAFRIGLVAFAALTAAGITWWQIGRGTRSGAPRRVPSSIKSWKGGDLLACAVTVDGASLQEFARQYNIVMMCGIRRPGDRLTDPATTVSRAFSIEPYEFEIQEAVSGPTRVLLAEMTRGNPASETPQGSRLIETDLWYELALLPKGVDAFNVRTLSDVERVGGRLLLTEPRWSVISAWQP